MRWHSGHRRRGGSFLLEASVALVLLIAAAGTIAQFVAHTSRARQQQWQDFVQEMRLSSAVERLQHVPIEQLPSTVAEMSDDDRYGSLQIETRSIEVEGVAGQVIVVRRTAEAEANDVLAELWRFSQSNGAGEATEGGDDE